MSTTYYDEDVTSDYEPDPEQDRRDMIIHTLVDYRLNAVSIPEALVMMASYLSQELENRSTGDLEGLYAQLVGPESQEVH
jgi:hypothetical protein